MSAISPINAHQQNSLPLLRRPRPPKPPLMQPPVSTTSRRTASSRQYGSKAPQGTSAERTRRSTYAHPTPVTPYTLYTQYTSTIGSSDQCEDTCDSGSTFTIHSLYPRGPPFLPPGKILKSTYLSPLSIYTDDVMSRSCNEEEGFTLNDFQLVAETSHRAVPSELQGAVISRENYLKLTSWFTVNVPKQESLNTTSIAVDCDHPGDRKPRHQVLIELRAMIQEVIEASGNVEDTPTVSSVSLDAPRWPTPSPGDIIFRSSTSRYFCGEGRSNSPFDASHQPLITPAEVAILECMMDGGVQLSLKAHFLDQLPVLSPLATTLTYLNVSFNDLRVFPAEVLQLHCLVCLRMRNNPIKEIPHDIRNLRKLEVFCISFNLLTDLPTGLFELISLVEIDVSHNSLQWLSKDVSKLRNLRNLEIVLPILGILKLLTNLEIANLRRLNVEGNQLSGLPSTALSLPLTTLLVSDNYFHPLLWQENTRNQPQALTDLCCVVLSRCVEDTRLPTEARQTLHNHQYGVCDCCGGSLYGAGLRVIRAVAQEQFGIKNLPLIFSVCSPTCRRKLKYRSSTYWTGTVLDSGT